jgi:hypothetical protein
MRFPAGIGLFLPLFCLVALPAASGQRVPEQQEGPEAPDISMQIPRRDANLSRSNVRLLTRAEGRTIARVAMNSRRRLSSRYDCSHFVHGLYRKAGFPYEYAPSSELYAGIPEFRRVTTPQPGDLAVWPGHAGIVIEPAQHSFLSVLHTGPGVNRYDSPYWKGRGRPHFLRYVEAVPRRFAANALSSANLRPDADAEPSQP